jgi:mannose-6-phosphate isomerase
MTVEKARVRAVAKPWGSRDLAPWSSIDPAGEAIGELWFDRADPEAPPPSLLLKLLFTTRPLSIQVHPDDDRARAIGLANGKTEAWYVLAADADAEVSLGPSRPIERSDLRAVIADGSIAALIAHRPVRPGELIFVPAGTIHAIGPGLVIAEIQQRSDTTWRLFDHGSDRELHVDQAVAAARLDPIAPTPPPRPVDEGRTRLVDCPQFVIERLEMAADARRAVVAMDELWLLVIGGGIRIGAVEAKVGEAVHLDLAFEILAAGPGGADVLLVHTARRPFPSLTAMREDTPAAPPAGDPERGA